VSAPFVATYAVLWILVLIIAAAVFLLFHMEGQRYLDSRAGRREQGPAREQALDPATWPGLDGEPVGVPERGMPNLLVFAATGCEPCGALRPHLDTFARSHSELSVTVVCAGRVVDVRGWTAGLDERIRVIPDVDGRITAGHRIGVTPFSVTVDERGVVREKGIVNDGVALASATLRVLSPGYAREPR